MEKIKHIIEALALRLLFGFFRLLPLDAASAIGGELGRLIGPFLSAHKTAQKNIAVVFPDLSATDKRALLAAMWDNLGRVAAELPHLPGKALHARVCNEDAAYVAVAGAPVIFFSGHFGNWELNYPMASQRGIPVTVIYREANNPYVDKMIAKLRATQAAGMIPKGPKGAVKLVRALKSGHSLAMLIDQKMNDGIAVPFFGRDAMTAPAIAELALRYDMPVIPVRVVRTGGCHFEAKIYPPITYQKTGDQVKDVLAIMTQINQMLENWIREHPAQWFWVHKRWPTA